MRASNRASSEKLYTAAGSYERTHGNGEIENDLAAEHLRPIISPPSLLSKAFNGSTYAGNRFEGHFEIGLRGVESVAAGRAGCGSWWRSSARRLKLVMSGVTILAFGCKRCKHTASQPPPQSRLRSTRRDKLPRSSPTPLRPLPPRRNLPTVAVKAILISPIPAPPSYSRVACAHAPLASHLHIARHGTFAASATRVAYARPYFSRQCQQWRRYRRHEATSCGRRAEPWTTRCEEAKGPTPATAHAARPAHRRPHQHRLWRFWRQQRLLQPAAEPRNRYTMQDHWLR
jgi:hypothetical protein